MPNFNYARTTVPALNALAERFMLFDPEDVHTVVGALDRGVSLDSLSATTTIPRFSVVLARYHSVRDTIRNGSVSEKANPSGPEPPLQMPTWGGRLPGRDIDAVIAYLLTLTPPEGT
ncbi:MAG: c-type cytochrome [Myxococcales bacterium]